jgi:hypothetical protein
MTVVVHAANSQQLVVTGWSNPSNAFSTTTNGVFATAAPAKNATISTNFGFADFTSGEVPDGSLIRSVTVTVNWGMTASVAGGTLGAQLFNNGVALGTETVQTVTTQQNATQIVLTGVALADLRSASTLLKALVRCSKGNTNTAMTGNLDFVSLTVDWVPAPPANKVVGAMRRAKQDAARLAKHRGGLISIGLAMSVVHGSLNQPLPFGLVAHGTATAATHPQPKVTVVKKPAPRGHKGGLIEIGQFIPAATAPGSANGTLNKPLPFGILARGQADFISFAAGMQVVHKPYVKPHRGRVIHKSAPGVTGRIGSLSQALPFGRTITGSVQVDGSLNKPIPFAILARGSVQVDGALNQPLPFGRSIAGSVQVDGSLNKPIPFGLISAGTTVSGRLGSLNQPLPFGRSIHGSVQVDGVLNQRLPFGLLAQASVRVTGTLNRAIPFGWTIRATTLGPKPIESATTLDVLSYQPSVADVLSLASSLDLANYISRSLDVTNQIKSLTILSSESDDMPNLVQPMKQGDTSPPLLATLGTLQTDGSISPDDLTGCTVVFNLKMGSKAIATDAACTILDAVNGKVQYNWGPNDTFKAGDAHFEFKSTDASLKVKRYPNNGDAIVKITSQVGI